MLLSPELIVELPCPASPRLSPDGHTAAFLLCRGSTAENAYVRDVWRVSPDSGAKPLTERGNVLDFRFLPDGGIVFTVDAGDETELYRLPASGGEPALWARLPLRGAEPPEPFLPGRFIFSAVSPEPSAADRQSAFAGCSASSADDGCRAAGCYPFRRDGAAPGAGNPSLWLWDGGKPVRLAPPGLAVTEYDAVGGRLLIRGFDAARPGTLFDGLWLWEDGTLAPLLPQDSFFISWARFFGGRVIAAMAPADGPADALLMPDLWELTPKGPQYFAPLAASLDGGVFSDVRREEGKTVCVDGGRLLFLSTVGDRDVVRSLGADGHISAPLTGNGSVDAFDARNGRLVYTSLTAGRFPEVYGRGPDGEERRLTDFHAALAGFSPPRPVFASGRRHPAGYVLPPEPFLPEKKYPAVVCLHGGPLMTFGDALCGEHRLLAQAGFFVLLCNPRGGDGRGRAFSRLGGRPGGDDLDDVLAFTDACLAAFPAIDGTRLGVMGGSYGGYLVNTLIGRTDRFRAAVSERSIANWASFCETSDIGPFYTETQCGVPVGGGTLPPPEEADTAENAARLWALSPLSRAALIRTPTLFVAGGEDGRCPASETLQMYGALRRRGVEARLLLFPGESHDLTREGSPRARLRRLREISAWFAARLGGRGNLSIR